MAGQVSVDWLTCVEDECIGICLSASNKCLAHASEEETAAALKLIGETGAIDARGVPITADLLHRIITAAPRGEHDRPLIKDCHFGRATFTGDARFDEATFTGDARFVGATFTGDAGFVRATFSSVAGFVRATFSSVAGFGGATFKRLASFEGVRFEQARQFGPLLAYRGLVLDDAQFAQPVQIEVSSTGVCCRRARFPSFGQITASPPVQVNSGMFRPILMNTSRVRVALMSTWRTPRTDPWFCERERQGRLRNLN
jgi:hypothetical protein